MQKIILVMQQKFWNLTPTYKKHDAIKHIIIIALVFWSILLILSQITIYLRIYNCEVMRESRQSSVISQNDKLKYPKCEKKK